MRTRLFASSSFLALAIAGALVTAEDSPRRDDFRQLDELLPSPNSYRTASGAPGHEYWQQRADYRIDVAIDEDAHHLRGSETITYTNNSPDPLEYLWVSIDPNIFSPESHAVLASAAPGMESMSYRALERMLARRDFDGSAEISSVTDERGAPLPHTIAGTMMRIDLPSTLPPGGGQVTFSIDWNYAINNSDVVGGRTGYEYFEEDGNTIYEMAQWFPRMAAYTDYGGWCNDQFLGRGEFTLEFGDYLVRITVPEDHVVASTGVLQNPGEVLTPEQWSRYEESRGATTPMFIVTPEEAEANESSEPEGTKTWVYHAEDVRDFAFASSRKFIWDAMGVDVDGRSVMAMSYWPKEGEPLWSRYSTHAVAHTLEVYSEHTIPYPYPVAISVNGPVGGMEYPMICFNGPRPEEDGTYSERTKYGLIGVIIHEVGHNWFPMIINSDERQWTWMDEGLNTFVQFLAEQVWEDDYPSRRGEPQDITGYMASASKVPIMTNSESLLQFGPNAYSKPATALNVLRETVMGRELFDFAFREYSRRWAFKRPEPADLFRTMEDASAVDLDWFWHGWFYTTDHVDLHLAGVERFNIDTQDPEIEKGRKREERDREPVTLTKLRNGSLERRTHDFPELLDFYNEYDELAVTPQDRERFEKLIDGLEEEQRSMLAMETSFYVLDIVNEGGIVMPIPVALHYTDGTHEVMTIPVDIWRKDGRRVKKLVMTDKEIAHVELDPRLELADTDLSDNRFPRAIESGRTRLTTGGRWGGGGKNPMQLAEEAAKKAAEAAKKAAAAEDSEEVTPVPASAEKAENGAEEAGAQSDGTQNGGGR